MNKKLAKKYISIAEKLGWEMRKSKTGTILYPPDGARPIPLHENSRNSAGRHKKDVIVNQLEKAGLVID